MEAIVHGLPELSRSIGPRPPRVNAAGMRRVGAKWEGFCCPVPSRNRAYVRCLGGSSECNVVIVGTCEWPVAAEPYRAKTAPLPRSSILFRPRRTPLAERGRNGGGAGYRPRVRYAYSTRRLSP
ncbi:MAG: hypothetical protein OJF58_002682 [Enhydrobacter sp.]|nr:MAG: hypothetical protein OJF58_002682 [Enhydrobacter sp.]